MSKIDDVRDVLIGLIRYIRSSILTIYILQWTLSQLNKITNKPFITDTYIKGLNNIKETMVKLV